MQISEEAKRQLIEYELIASYPIYKSLENRGKLIIKKHTHTIEEQYPAWVIKGYNSMSIDLKANRIWLIEDESSSEYLDELQDYPTLPSTIVLEDLEKDKYMLVKSYRREYESHMKKILIKLGKGEYFNQPNQDIGMESNIVRKLERQ